MNLCATTGPPNVNTVTTVGSWFFISEPSLPLIEHPMLMQTSLGGDSINWTLLACIPASADLDGPADLPSSPADAESGSGEYKWRIFRRSNSEMQILQCFSSSENPDCCIIERRKPFLSGVLEGVTHNARCKTKAGKMISSLHRLFQLLHYRCFYFAFLGHSLCQFWAIFRPFQCLS